MNLYVGIDVASTKHNCCIMDDHERVIEEVAFTNDQAGI